MKTKRTILIITLLLFALCLCACDQTPTNDKTYSLSDLVGTYYAPGIAYSYNDYVEFSLVIDSNGTATATSKYVNANASRYNPIGSDPDDNISIEFSGTVNIGKNNITIGSKKGYITTTNGVTIIHINDTEYKKVG